MAHVNQSVHNELTKLRGLIEGRGMKKQNERKIDTKLEKLHERFEGLEAKSGGLGAQEDEEGEIAEIK
jgi:N12 class adenine-specific DNA methylase